MVMKKFIILLLFSVLTVTLLSQKVSNYTYRLDNGITVRTEMGWNQVWVSQSFVTATAADKVPLVLSTRTLGDLVKSSSFRLMSAGKEVKVQGARPGNYSMSVTFSLSGVPGEITFEIDNVEIRSKSKTTVSVTLYDYQAMISESAGTRQGMSGFTTKIERYKGNPELNPTCGVTSFYPVGSHGKPAFTLPGDGKSGSVKPGTYDVLITIGAQERMQKIWLEKFELKPNIQYAITLNLNGGVVEYAGGNRDVKAIHLYPAGMADRQQGAAKREANLETLRCEGIGVTSPCPPGTYDVLVNFNNGARYEWRKNIAVSTGRKTQVK